MEQQRGATRQQPVRNQRETRSAMVSPAAKKSELKSQQELSTAVPVTPQIRSNPNAKSISELTAYDVDKDLRAVYRDCLKATNQLEFKPGIKSESRVKVLISQMRLECCWTRNNSLKRT